MTLCTTQSFMAVIEFSEGGLNVSLDEYMPKIPQGIDTGVIYTEASEEDRKKVIEALKANIDWLEETLPTASTLYSKERVKAVSWSGREELEDFIDNLTDKINEALLSPQKKVCFDEFGFFVKKTEERKVMKYEFPLDLMEEHKGWRVYGAILY